MTTRAREIARLIPPAAVAAGLLAAPFAATTAHAQEPPPPEGGEAKEGRPLDGYLATLCLVMLLFFIVGKSARR